MLDTSYSAIQDFELLKIWATRYMPDLTIIPIYLRQTVMNRLSEAVSVASRQAMADSILQNLEVDCAFASAQTQKICLQAGDEFDAFEAKSIEVKIRTIYEKLLQLYVEDFAFEPVLNYLYDFDTPEGKINAAAEILPSFEHLNQTIEPLLQQLQGLYLYSSNRRAIGFLTTQLHLTRQNVLNRLNLYGKMWLGSYFKLVEELVCIPWRRICTAALRPDVSPVVLTMVKKILPKSQAIARSVYQKARQEFPTHISRQGSIQSAAVEASSLRDLSMFQAYIWLCVLEGNLSVVERELLPLCLLVFPSVKVKWPFVECGVAWINREIQAHLNGEQIKLFTPYAQQIQQLFAAANPQLVDVAQINQAMKAIAFGSPTKSLSTA